MSASPGLVARAVRMVGGSQKADEMPGGSWREAREERPNDVTFPPGSLKLPKIPGPLCIK
jgi:hypothetical protein